MLHLENRFIIEECCLYHFIMLQCHLFIINNVFIIQDTDIYILSDFIDPLHLFEICEISTTLILILI